MAWLSRKDGSVVDWFCDVKVLGLSPGKSGMGIIFSSANFLCQLNSVSVPPQF